MTHFLFLEKGAQPRDAQRVQREKSAREGSGPRARRHEESPAQNPAFLVLMVPTGSGYRVLKASLEEIGEIPAAEIGTSDNATSAAQTLERLLASASGADLLKRIDGTQSASVAPLAGRASRESFGDVEIDVPARVVSRRGEVVPLAPMEFDLLLALVRRNGAAVSRRDLLREVWGTTKAISLRTVDTHVANLRRKLEHDVSHPRHILTVKKVGYRLKR
jgi:DNA-binding response OmpR family regulator